MKSHIAIVNAPVKIKVPKEHLANKAMNEFEACLKHGRPIRSKDKNLQKRKLQRKEIGTLEEAIPTK